MTNLTSHGEVWVEPLTQTVLVQLRELILSGGLAAGVRLRAEGLATRLGVSRTPLRSALAILAAEGLVRYETNRGYTVREQSLELIIAAIEARAPLQAEATRILSRRPDRAAVIRHLTVVENQMSAISHGDAWSEEIEAAWFGAFYGFHRMILHGAGNPFLRTAMRMTIVYPVFGDLLRIYPPVARRVRPELLVMPITPPPFTRESAADHERLLMRLSEGDGERAAALVYEQALRQRDRILGSLITPMTH